MENEDTSRYEEGSYRVETDEETGEPRVIYSVPHLSVDEMRDRVVRILSGELYPSDQVRDTSVFEMVFLPVTMGALRPDSKLVEKFMGSESPPEVIEGDPERPAHPGYPDLEYEEPKYPELIRPDTKIKSDVEWGDREPEEWAAHWAEVESKNQDLIRKWEREVEAHQTLIEDYDKVRAKVDEEYEKTLADWRVLLEKSAERNAERERRNKEWVARYNRVFSRWGEEIGVLVGDMKKTFSRSINGYPIFFEFSIVRPDDWERIRNALIREIGRSKDIEV